MKRFISFNPFDKKIIIIIASIGRNSLNVKANSTTIIGASNLKKSIKITSSSDKLQKGTLTISKQ
jgi:hypothetical protein